jgi:hypothetical protein
LETLKISVGELALGPMEKLVRKFADGAQWANDFVTELEKLSAKSDGVAKSQVNAGDSVAHTGATMSAGTEAAIRHAAAMEKLANTGHGLATGARQVGSAFVWLSEKTYDGIDATSRFNDKLGEMTKSGARAVAGFAHDAGEDIAHFAKKAADVVESLPGKIKGAIGDLAGVLVPAGKAVIGGFISGIESKIPDVRGVLHAITDKLPDWKGPPSYDRTILTSSGQLVIEGFVAGLESRYKDAEKSLKGFGSSLAVSADIQQAARTIGVKQAESIAAGFVQGTPSLQQQIRQSLAQAVTSARQAIAEQRQTLAGDFRSLADGILQAFDERVQAWKSPASKLLAKMQLEDTVAQLKQQLAQATADLATAQTNIAAADASGDPEQVKQAQQQLLQAQQTFTAAQRAITENDLAQQDIAQTAAHDKATAKQREHLAGQLLTLQSELAKHPEEWRKIEQKDHRNPQAVRGRRARMTDGRATSCSYEQDVRPGEGGRS